MTDSQTPSPPVAKLAAKVAHELNNPLDAVLRLVSLAQRKARSGDYADVDRHLADAQFGLQRMAEILRELMDIGRQSHESDPRPQPAPLVELIAQAARSMTLQAEQKHMSIQVETDLPAELTALYDLRLSQVLANLLKNALDAGPEHSSVRLTVLLDEAGLKITVEDTGPGIDPQILPRLFMPFATTKPRGKGHGLGLAISRELVTSLGGTLAIENRTPQGCLATIRLPVH